MLLRPCILQYIVNFPGSWRSFQRPLDAAQKPTSNMLKEKLGKACTRKRTLGEGNHRPNCNFKPSNMRRVLATIAVHRESMESQLRSRTLLTAMQRDAALDHLYGPKPPSGSSSSGGFKGGAISSEMERLPQGGVRGGVRRVNRGVRSPKPTQAPIGNFSGPFFEVRLVLFINRVPLCSAVAKS